MKYLIAVVLALALVFAVSTASLAVTVLAFPSATPNTAAGDGQFELFGGYSSWFASGFTFGAGYGFADGFTLGAMYSYFGFDCFGAYANLTFEPIVLKGDIYFTPAVQGRAGGYLTFGLDPVTFGLGGGAMFGISATPLFFVGGDVSIAAGGNFTLYGSVSYIPGLSSTLFEGGLALGF